MLGPDLTRHRPISSGPTKAQDQAGVWGRNLPKDRMVYCLYTSTLTPRYVVRNTSRSSYDPLPSLLPTFGRSRDTHMVSSALAAGRVQVRSRPRGCQQLSVPHLLEPAAHTAAGRGRMRKRRTAAGVEGERAREGGGALLYISSRTLRPATASRTAFLAVSSRPLLLSLPDAGTGNVYVKGG